MSGSPRTVWTPAKEAKAVRLWRRGNTVLEIAKQIKVARQTVHYHLSRRDDVNLSPPGGALATAKPKPVDTPRSVVVTVPNRSAVGNSGPANVEVSVPRLRFLEEHS